MSSVQSFIRQIPATNSFFTISDVSANVFYTFNPTSANQFPGNYPNGVGFVNTGPISLVTILQAAGQTAGLLRDMGKTIKCTINTPTSTNFTQYFFREVQVVFGNLPVQNGASTQGVGGSTVVPSSLNQYYTYYVPITVGGVAPPPGTTAVLTATLNGVM